nr:ribonuclease HI family protein [Candidatus Levybacteria bacterium]
MAKIQIYTDGGSRGNPGPAALGVYITDGNNKEIAKIGKIIGEATNNVAEYSAITEAFAWVLANKDKHAISEIHFYMDSQLAYSQIVGLYKVKNERIRDFIFEIRQKEAELGVPVYYNHIFREKNKNADLMVNLALDNLL